MASERFTRVGQRDGWISPCTVAAPVRRYASAYCSSSPPSACFHQLKRQCYVGIVVDVHRILLSVTLAWGLWIEVPVTP